MAQIQKRAKKITRCVSELFKMEPIKMIGYTAINVIYSFMWVLQVMILQTYFDIITEVNNEFMQVIWGLMGVGFIYFFYHFMDGLSNCYPETISLSINKGLSVLISKRISMLEAIEFEETKRLEQINKALAGSRCLVWVGFALLDIVSYYLTYFLFMGSYLFVLDPLLAISIVIVFVPVIITKWIDIGIFKKLEDNLAPLRRKMEYYEKCVADREYFKETRFLGANTFFIKLFSESLEKYNHFILTAQLKKNLINCILNIITAMSYGIIILILFWKIMEGSISIGAFVAVLTSINNLYRFMHKMVMERLGWVSENVGAVWNYFEFIDEVTKRKIIRCNENVFVKLTDVAFKYPNSEIKVLEGINLKIRENEKIAIVGENGSGKSTLCRIIMGLYSPIEGEVSYGKELIDANEISRVSAVFQKFVRYKMSLKDNIIISAYNKKVNDSEIENLCEQCGIAWNKDYYQDGIETLLGNEFGGTDISGGQWQRVAIARGVHRSGELIVLDEPTAAIDPIEEARIYKEFQRIGKNRAIIMITHRLGSAQLADRIIVLKEGRIVQEGTHEELLGVKGEYRKMFLSQKKWYD